MNNRYDEPLVGSLALIFSVVTIAIAVGPWESPYRLASISAIQARFGKFAARAIWGLIAIASLTSGLAILGGLRPSYATPAGRTEEIRHN